MKTDTAYVCCIIWHTKPSHPFYAVACPELHRDFLIAANYDDMTRQAAKYLADWHETRQVASMRYFNVANEITLNIKAVEKTKEVKYTDYEVR